MNKCYFTTVDGNKYAVDGIYHNGVIINYLHYDILNMAAFQQKIYGHTMSVRGKDDLYFVQSEDGLKTFGSFKTFEEAIEFVEELAEQKEKAA